MILNLFIAVIFEGFEDSQKAEEREVVTLCVEEWRNRDPDLALTLPLEDAMAFITKCVSETQVFQFLFDLHECMSIMMFSSPYVSYW